MKCVFILLVIGIFGQSIFAVEQTESEYKHNQNLTFVLYDKVVNQLNKMIPIFLDWDEFLIPYAKAKENALNEVCHSKISSKFNHCNHILFFHSLISIKWATAINCLMS